MQASHLPRNSVREIVDFYFAWKTTESYIYYRIHNTRGAVAPVRMRAYARVFAPSFTHTHTGAHRKARRSMIEKLNKMLDDPYVSDDSVGLYDGILEVT